MSAIIIGEKHEDIAATHISEHGLQILHRNFKCKLGEIDIIAADQLDLVFIEVRYRKDNIFGGAVESVTKSKQQKIVNAAKFYLQTHNWAQQLNCRFDVIAISKSTQEPYIEWIKDAFYA